MKPGSRPDDSFADTVGEIVAALDQDPVLVEEVMGNGHTEEIRQVLSEKAAASPIPVHVVLTAPPREITSTEANEELLSVLHGRVGVDGVWLVATTGGYGLEVRTYTDLVPDDEYDETRLSSAVNAALEDVQEATDRACDHCSASTPALEAAVTMDVLAAGIPEDWDVHPLTEEQIDGYATSTWWDSTSSHAEYVEPTDMPTSGTYAMVATVAAVCVTVVAYRLAQAVGGRRHGRLRGKPRPSLPTRAELSAQVISARADAAAAYRTLEKALGRTRARSDDATAWERRDIATACLERAESRVGADDLLEVVGALVLARTGSYALHHAHGQYRCCYVDPRHGEARQEAQLGGGLQVPVCRACATAIAKDRPLEPLLSEGRFGSLHPYYERSSVWSRTGFGSLGGDWWREVPR